MNDPEKGDKNKDLAIRTFRVHVTIIGYLTLSATLLINKSLFDLLGKKPIMFYFLFISSMVMIMQSTFVEKKDMSSSLKLTLIIAYITSLIILFT